MARLRIRQLLVLSLTPSHYNLLPAFTPSLRITQVNRIYNLNNTHMTLEAGVWSLMQSLKVDELIASKTGHHNPLRKVIPRSRAYRHERFEFTQGAVKMVLDRRDYSQWRIFSGGLHINTAIFRYVPVNPYHFDMIDVGANVGGFTTLFSAEMDVENLNVHVFEPNPRILSRLEENMRLLEASNLAVNTTVNPYALGEQACEGTLSINEDHSGISTMARTNHLFTSVVPVKVVSLDNYVMEKGIEHLDFIKIDVEASEPSVLNGARLVLKELKPALYFEYQLDWFANYEDAYLTDLLDFLYETGYVFYREERDGTLHPFKIAVDALRHFRHLNILGFVSQFT